MSAIDTTFHWVRNPTVINGLVTTYVSKRGSDVSGDGTAQNPYASIAKITSVALANTNIMIDDGEWNEARTANGRVLHWWGNGKTKIRNNNNYIESYYYIFLTNLLVNSNFSFCFCEDINTLEIIGINAKNSVVRITAGSLNTSNIENCIVYRNVNGGHHGKIIFKNCCLINTPFYNLNNCSYFNCNFTTTVIPTSPVSLVDNCINNTSTGQTFSDYFNHYDPNNWENCDFTAKEGSANIGAGTKGSTIGFNQGYTMYADNSADSVFKISNGATLKNIAWDSNLNGYTLVQKERTCQGATSNTITLDSSASSEDDYYNNLFICIVAGDGYGELFLITDYDGATKTATIDGTWTTTPTTSSIYTISGTILSATKDFGKVIKVKRNWTFADNFTALTDGQWAEFMTHVETNGKQFPTSCYSYEYSTDGVNFIQGQTTDDLVSATNGENKVTGNIYGDCSANYDVATAKNLIMRYIRVRVHIGFNIGQIGE